MNLDKFSENFTNKTYTDPHYLMANTPMPQLHSKVILQIYNPMEFI